MMQFPRFTKEQSTRLIKEVKKRPCLWNKDVTKYSALNKTLVVGRAWKIIASRMELPENVVKMKWKNLRDTFYRMVSRHPVGSSEYSGDWPYFRDMLFLITPRDINEEPLPEMDHSQEDLEQVQHMLKEYQPHEEQDQEYIVFSINKEDDEPTEVLPHSDNYYDLLFLESLAPYFLKLDPVRRVAMRVKIQDMLMEEINEQNRKM